MSKLGCVIHQSIQVLVRHLVPGSSFSSFYKYIICFINYRLRPRLTGGAARRLRICNDPSCSESVMTKLTGPGGPGLAAAAEARLRAPSQRPAVAAARRRSGGGVTLPEAGVTHGCRRAKARQTPADLTRLGKKASGSAGL
jgi:hypothetical protein